MLDRLVTYCIAGVVIWVFASIMLATGLSLVCIPFLFFDLYSKVFISAYVAVEVCFTILFICAMIDTVIKKSKNNKEE